MPLGTRIRRAVVFTAGLFLVVCVAFIDVQIHFRDRVVTGDKEIPQWNISARHRTLMQRFARKDHFEKNLDYSLAEDEQKQNMEFLDNYDWKEQVDVDRGGVRRRLPGAIIIGVKKGGTRALLEILRLHPDVVAPGPEIHFFDRHYHKGLQWYRSQMPFSYASQLTMEKTPGYLVTLDAPKRVSELFGETGIKLLLVVRDPVTRALSDYAQSASKRTQDTRTFEDMAFRNTSTGLVDPDWIAIRLGQYAKHLEHWMKYFPMSRIHVVSGEKLVEDPVQELKAVQRFLGIRPVISSHHFFFNQSKGFPCLRKSSRSHVPRCLGKTKGRSHPQVPPAALQRLRDFFRPFNLKFYKMVGRDFGWS